jgi:hypothetical protein
MLVLLAIGAPFRSTAPRLRWTRATTPRLPTSCSGPCAVPPLRRPFGIHVRYGRVIVPLRSTAPAWAMGSYSLSRGFCLPPVRWMADSPKLIASLLSWRSATGSGDAVI